MANNSQSVCLNHPDSPAVARCTLCSKPICEQCIIERNGCCYCSQQCADSVEQSLGRVQSVTESKKRADRNSFVRRMIILILLIILAAIGYWYYQNNEEQVQSVVKKAEQKIKETKKDVKAKAQGKKSEIQEKVPGDSKYKKEREDLVK